MIELTVPVKFFILFDLLKISFMLLHCMDE